MAKTIRIAGASGFWGDSEIAVPQLLREPVDFITFDYLAEITMSILARARAKDPQTGYVSDFVPVVLRHAATFAARGIKVVANAGGVNPLACAQAIEAGLIKAGVALKVGVVTGDDLIERAPALRAQGATEMFSGEAMPAEVLSLNAYLGAEPIAALLDQGADIVVTGRCVDSAVTLGACIHAFGWTREQLNERAGGSLAGHIIECGAQATGGIHTDWEATGDWADIGYPIVEVAADGSFTVRKPRETGGLVSHGTVAEQLLYEIGDPAAYILPDVVCDFTQVDIIEIGPDEVRVSGALGHPATASYKASGTWMDGYRVGAYYMIGGIDAARKAEKVADAVFRRCAALFEQRGIAGFTETSFEAIGAEATYGPASRGRASREVMLKIARDDDPLEGRTFQQPWLQVLLHGCDHSGQRLSGHRGIDAGFAPAFGAVARSDAHVKDLSKRRRMRRGCHWFTHRQVKRKAINRDDLGAAIIILSGIYVVFREETPHVSRTRPVLQSQTRFVSGTYPRISSLRRLFADRRSRRRRSS